MRPKQKLDVKTHRKENTRHLFIGRCIQVGFIHQLLWHIEHTTLVIQNNRTQGKVSERKHDHGRYGNDAFLQISFWEKNQGEWNNA